MANPNVISAEELKALTGYDRDGDVIRWLQGSGVEPFTRNGKLVMVTIQQLNAAKGVNDPETLKSSDVL